MALLQTALADTAVTKGSSRCFCRGEYIQNKFSPLPPFLFFANIHFSFLPHAFSYQLEQALPKALPPYFWRVGGRGVRSTKGRHSRKSCRQWDEQDKACCRRVKVLLQHPAFTFLNSIWFRQFQSSVLMQHGWFSLQGYIWADRKAVRWWWQQDRRGFCFPVCMKMKGKQTKIRIKGADDCIQYTKWTVLFFALPWLKSTYNYAYKSPQWWKIYWNYSIFFKIWTTEQYRMKATIYVFFPLGNGATSKSLVRILDGRFSFSSTWNWWKLDFSPP